MEKLTVSDACEVRIGVLRARGVDVAEAARRLALERALGNAALVPAGFPPHAVLIVRRVSSSLPFAGGGEWTGQVRARLEALWRAAARPAYGAFDTGAEAVLFADEAELRACLLRDLAAGVAWQRWWWGSWLRRLPGASAVSSAMAAVFDETQARLPAVIALLHSWGALKVVAAALTEDDARSLVLRVAATYQLPHVAASITGRAGRGTPGRVPPATGGTTAPPGDPVQSPAVAEVDASARGESGSDAAGEQWLDSLWVTLGDTVQAPVPRATALLALLGIVLAREPWRLRSHAVQKAVVRRCLRRFSEPADVGRPAETRVAGGGSRWTPRLVGAAAGPLQRRMREIAVDAQGRDAATRRVERVREVPADCVAPDRAPTSTQATKAGKTSAPIASEQRATRAEPATTRLGGVLYLINLMTALDLPEWLAPGAGPWSVLETLGRYWSAGLEGSGDDELWGILAGLDGRNPGESPGGDFRGRPDYRQPHDWLDQAEARDAPLCWAARSDRLRLWSETAGIVADVTRDGRPAARRAREEMVLAGFDPSRPLHRTNWRRTQTEAALPFSTSADYARLLGALLPAAQRRLALALGVQPEERIAFAELLRLRAHIHTSSSHVDLFANIDDISLPARRAGLDRDPGWLPNFGRVVLFHFE